MFEKLVIGATFDYGKFKGQVNEIGGNSNGNNGRASKAGKGGKSNNVGVISISEGEISFFAEGVAFVLELVLMLLFSLLIALGSSKRLISLFLISLLHNLLKSFIISYSQPCRSTSQFSSIDSATPQDLCSSPIADSDIGVIGKSDTSDGMHESVFGSELGSELRFGFEFEFELEFVSVSVLEVLSVGNLKLLK
ncbi:MAG: hypothetical protein EZS28_016504 [Streblomastix strix]|uniref:Uncharacterized protein n=1 Tax=Streblomastix strix TaxID=222440 RepID=A0A5J4W046_9EUKA|nr:MAG: hypothetical protein EZS28_016504 [Streblomastix strix]